MVEGSTPPAITPATACAACANGLKMPAENSKSAPALKELRSHFAFVWDGECREPCGPRTNEWGFLCLRSAKIAVPKPMTEAQNLKIAIVEDQPKIREGLRTIIDGTDGYRCVGSFGSMEEALGKLDRELPDVPLMDLGLPGMSGIDGTRRIKDLHPGV